MLELLTAPFANAPAIAPGTVAVRLLAAAVLGGLVSLVYRRTRPAADVTSSFSTTLVLLSILIAMVTQVIGDNVARAFSLVGALSIGRFRTVVRDTQDTAYVIFAVVIGMAVGSSDLWVALIGLGVVGATAAVLRPRAVSSAAVGTTANGAGFLLHLRVGLGHDLKTLFGDVLDRQLVECQLREISTAKQGIAIDVSYDVRFRKDGSPDDLVKALNRIEGIQSVELQRRDITVEPL